MNVSAGGILVEGNPGAVPLTHAIIIGNKVVSPSGLHAFGVRSLGGSDYILLLGNNLRDGNTTPISLVGLNNVNTGNIT